MADARDQPTTCNSCGTDCPQGLTGGVCPVCLDAILESMRDDEREYFDRMNLEQRYQEESSDG